MSKPETVRAILEVFNNDDKHIYEDRLNIACQSIYTLLAEIDISDKEMGEIIMFIRHNIFLPENNKREKLKEMIDAAWRKHLQERLK